MLLQQNEKAGQEEHVFPPLLFHSCSEASGSFHAPHWQFLHPTAGRRRDPDTPHQQQRSISPLKFAWSDRLDSDFVPDTPQSTEHTSEPSAAAVPSRCTDSRRGIPEGREPRSPPGNPYLAAQSAWGTLCGGTVQSGSSRCRRERLLLTGTARPAGGLKTTKTDSPAPQSPRPRRQRAPPRC